MIPVGDVIPTRTRPLVTGLALAAGTWLDAREAFGAVRAAGTGIIAAAAAFFHPQPLALVSNMAVLWLFGPALEDRLGHRRFAAAVVLCGAAAALAHRIGTGGAAAPGVSGAVAGIVCGYLVRYPASSVLFLVPAIVTMRIVEMPASVCGAMWLLLQIGAGFASAGGDAPARAPIDLLAYAAGALAGAGTVVLLRRRERERVEWWNDRPLTR
jgi:membrane associated rhomboid family serine protease